MNKTFIIYGLTALGLWGLAIYFARGDFFMFIDAPTFMIIYAIPLVILLSHFRPGEIIRSFRLAGSSTDGTRAELKNALLFFKETQQLIFTAALIGFFLGFMMMTWLYPKSADFFARGLVMSLLSVVYALLGAFLITIPFKTAIRMKLNRME